MPGQSRRGRARTGRPGARARQWQSNESCGTARAAPRPDSLPHREIRIEGRSLTAFAVVGRLESDRPVGVFADPHRRSGLVPVVRAFDDFPMAGERFAGDGEGHCVSLPAAASTQGMYPSSLRGFPPVPRKRDSRMAALLTVGPNLVRLSISTVRPARTVTAANERTRVGPRERSGDRGAPRVSA